MTGVSESNCSVLVGKTLARILTMKVVLLLLYYPSACSVSAVPHLSPFLAELEKMDTSRLMEELRFMDSLRAEKSWSTPKAVYTWVSRLKVWQDYQTV